MLLERAANVFGTPSAPTAPVVDLKELHAKIGQLTLEKVFLRGALSKAVAQRRSMIDRRHGLSLALQAQLMRISSTALNCGL